MDNEGLVTFKLLGLKGDLDLGTKASLRFTFIQSRQNDTFLPFVLKTATL